MLLQAMDDDDEDDEPDEQPIDATMPGRCGATTNGQTAPSSRPTNNGHPSSSAPSPIDTSTAAAIAAAAGQLSLNQVMTPHLIFFKSSFSCAHIV